MGMAKRYLERSSIRIRDLDGENIQCQKCKQGDAGYLEVIDASDVTLICKDCVEESGMLCPRCEDGIVSGEEIPDADWKPIVVCAACAAAFYEQ